LCCVYSSGYEACPHQRNDQCPLPLASPPPPRPVHDAPSEKRRLPQDAHQALDKKKIKSAAGNGQGQFSDLFDNFTTLGMSFSGFWRISATQNPTSDEFEPQCATTSQTPTSYTWSIHNPNHQFAPAAPSASPNLPLPRILDMDIRLPNEVESQLVTLSPHRDILPKLQDTVPCQLAMLLWIKLRLSGQADIAESAGSGVIVHESTNLEVQRSLFLEDQLGTVDIRSWR